MAKWLGWKGHGRSEQSLNRHVSHMPGVHGPVVSVAKARGAVAKEVLAWHRYQGHSKIEVTEGDVDAYVMLTDERGERAAHIIEYGRKESSHEYLDAHGKVRYRLIPAWEGVGAIRAAMRG